MHKSYYPAWGKTDKDGDFHHLAHHCADVSAVLLELLEHKVYRSRLHAAAGQRLTDIDCLKLAAITFLHDIGKLHPAFQAKGWPDGLWSGKKRSHLDTGLIWCDELKGREDTALAGVLPALASWCGENLGVWMQAIFAHHGRPVGPRGTPKREDSAKKYPHYDWLKEEGLLGQAMREWFSQAFDDSAPLPYNHRFMHLYTGLVALSDWVGSDRSAFSFHQNYDLDYWRTAREKAKKHTKAIGLAPGSRGLQGKVSFNQVSEHPSPTAVQSIVAGIPADQNLVILESETGSGKTEAAIWRFAALRSAGQVESLYFAVPTRAAARQLKNRVQAAMNSLFDDPPDVILAIPGQFQAGDAIGKPLPNWKVLWDDDSGVSQPSRWAAEHATRYLAAEVAVGTVDQAMLSTLLVKHAHLRGFSLSRALLVIDEVHASDTYMRQIQKNLVDEHLALGGHALLMSATLGASARASFLDEDEPAFEDAVNTPYPAVWTRGKGGSGLQSPEGKLPDKVVQVRAQCGWDEQKACEIAIDAASKGARVLMVRNTVKTAQDTFRQLCNCVPDLAWQVEGGPAMHHSRFAAEDRVVLDNAIEASLGKSSQRGDGCVVIGTQTLEQSLDIDADFLVTDLCPMDVLLQRIGRLHRHDRPRPAGFEKAQVVVMYPENGLDALVEGFANGKGFDNGLGLFRQQGSWAGVYVDVPGVQSVLEQIERFPVWEIPSMNRMLVEHATHPEATEAIAEARNWQEYWRQVCGMDVAQWLSADRVVLEKDKDLPSVFPSDEKIRTRLGEEGAMLGIEDGAVIGPFGGEITQFALPPHWSRGLSEVEDEDGKVRVAISEHDGMLAFSLNDGHYRYSRVGLERSKESN